MSGAAVRRPLRWAQRILLAGAVCMLGYCGFVLIDTWTFQKAERHQLELLLIHQQDTQSGGRQSAQPTAPKRLQPTVNGALIGRIDIPRLGVSVIVIEGTSSTILKRALGHIPWTALPGQPGNVGISGHRDTFFRPLRHIQRNDIIVFTTPLGQYRYSVVSTKIVDPHNLAVLDASGDQILTLVTCYPFYYVGSAPDRFIVRNEAT